MSAGSAIGSQQWPMGGYGAPLGTQHRSNITQTGSSSGQRQPIMPRPTSQMMPYFQPNMSFLPMHFPPANMPMPSGTHPSHATHAINYPVPLPAKPPAVPLPLQAFDNALKRAQADLMKNLQLFQPGVRNRLLLALESRLPNEIEWALQKIISFSFICPETFVLDSIPGLLDAMLGTISDWTNLDVEPSVKESPTQLSRKREYRALLFSYDNSVAQEPETPNNGNEKKLSTLWWKHKIQSRCDMLIYPQNEDDLLFRRVLQISLIIRNFSFIDVNKKSMANNDRCRTFLLLLFYTTRHILEKKRHHPSHIYRALFFDMQRHVWETLESLGQYYPLNTSRKEKKDREEKKEEKANDTEAASKAEVVKKDPYLKLAVDMLFNNDRMVILIALRLLLEWSFCEVNESTMIHLDRVALRRICDLVMVNDAALRSASLDLLYQLAHLHSDAVVRIIHVMPTSFPRVLVSIVTERINPLTSEPSRVQLPQEILDLMDKHRSTAVTPDVKDEVITDNLSEETKGSDGVADTFTSFLSALPEGLSPKRVAIVFHWLRENFSQTHGARVCLTLSELTRLFGETQTVAEEKEEDETQTQQQVPITVEQMQSIVSAVYPEIVESTKDKSDLADENHPVDKKEKTITLYLKDSASPVMKKLMASLLRDQQQQQPDNQISNNDPVKTDPILEEESTLDGEEKTDPTEPDNEESMETEEPESPAVAVESDDKPDTQQLSVTNINGVSIEDIQQQQQERQQQIDGAEKSLRDAKALTRERILVGQLPKNKENSLPMTSHTLPFFPMMFNGSHLPLPPMPHPSSSSSLMPPMMNPYMANANFYHLNNPYFQNSPQLATSFPSFTPTLPNIAAPVAAQPNPPKSEPVQPAVSKEEDDRVAQLVSRTYDCEWQGCDLRFKLLDLWKHMTDDHVPYAHDGTYSCHWGRCRKYEDGMKNRGSLIAHVKSHIPDIYRIPMRADTIGKTGGHGKDTLGGSSGQNRPVYIPPPVRPYGYNAMMMPDTMASMHGSSNMLNTLGVKQMMGDYGNQGGMQWMPPSSSPSIPTATFYGGPSPMGSTNTSVPSIPGSMELLSVFRATTLKLDFVGAPLVAALLLRQIATCPLGHLALLSIQDELVWWWGHDEKIGGLIAVILMELRKPLEVEKKKEGDS